MNKTDAVITRPNKLISVQQWQDVLNNVKPGAHVLIGSTTDLQHRQTVNIEDAGFEIRDLISYMYVVDNNIELQLWTLARKPLTESTIAKNVIKYGTGSINIDDSRVSLNTGEVKVGGFGNGAIGFGGGDAKGVEWQESTEGRFPANFMHDGSNLIKDNFPYTKSGKMGPQHTRTTDGSPNGIYGKFDVNHPLAETIGDEGSASRFFKELPTEQDLIKYLVKLITPPNGVVLDPFNTINIEETRYNE